MSNIYYDETEDRLYELVDGHKYDIKCDIMENITYAITRSGSHSVTIPFTHEGKRLKAIFWDMTDDGEHGVSISYKINDATYVMTEHAETFYKEYTQYRALYALTKQNLCFIGISRKNPGDIAYYNAYGCRERDITIQRDNNTEFKYTAIY
jgi:hypothetical protein